MNVLHYLLMANTLCGLISIMLIECSIQCSCNAPPLLRVPPTVNSPISNLANPSPFSSGSSLDITDA